MSFATSLALLVAVLVGLPLAAHLLRRGKTEEQEFPPVHLVPVVAATSDRRSRLEDRWLLLLRAAMVAALAILGATPFVRCSRLSVDRPQGASVALALVVDDSQSMRSVLPSGETRFEAAVHGAQQLLSSAREGDAIAILLAGNPARLVLSATLDLKLARSTLDALRVTDRSTDVGEAVQLARVALKELPHVEKRVVLLSDLADQQLPNGEPPLWAPLASLRSAVDNCGISKAERLAQSVVVTVGCNSSAAANERSVEVLLADDPSAKALTTLTLQAVSGEQTLSGDVSSFDFELKVRLTGKDGIERDNQAYVAARSAGLRVAVLADTNRAAVVTGGPTILEQALGALDETLDVRPLGSVPEAVDDLAGTAALLVDDPAGLGPEARSALTAWVTRGGTLLGLLGPALNGSELTASIEPFARQGARWENQPGGNLDPTTFAWLGESAQSLQTLAERGRVRLDGSDLPETEVMGRWQDGVPWLFRRRLGRGAIFTVGLPASVEQSDFALRPGFLALLAHVISVARERVSPQSSAAGSTWAFPVEAAPTVFGPLEHQGTTATLTAAAAPNPRETWFVPELTGLYNVEYDGKKERRVVILDAPELTRQPLDVTAGDTKRAEADASARVDTSPEWALALLGLFTLELLMRTFGPKVLGRLRRA